MRRKIFPTILKRVHKTTNQLLSHSYRCNRLACNEFIQHRGFLVSQTTATTTTTTTKIASKQREKRIKHQMGSLQEYADYWFRIILHIKAIMDEWQTPSRRYEKTIHQFIRRNTIWIRSTKSYLERWRVYYAWCSISMCNYLTGPILSASVLNCEH